MNDMNTSAELSVRARIEKALAGKWGWLPTAGPWFARFNGVSASEDRDEGDWVARSMGTRGKTELEEINNVYIAAVNPAAIRELLDEHEALIQSQAAEIERMRGLVHKAFEEGFYSPRTYNDVILNTSDDAWAESHSRAATTQPKE